MPNSVIAELHEKSGIEESKLEAIWKTAVTHAKKNNIANPEAYANGAVQHAANNKALDSSRFVDDNGYLIAPNSIITGADVAKYYGAEIPRYKDLGLNPQQIYHVYRPIEEIKDNDFSGKFLLDKHIGDFEAATHDTHRDHIIGTVYDCVQAGDRIVGTVSFADPQAIDALDNGKKYLSAGYWYTPVIGAGMYEGQHYDIKMTDIRANHVAHVDNPRYKSAVVGDEDSINKEGVKPIMKFKNKLLDSLMNRIRGLGLDEESVKKMEEEAKAEDEAAEEAKKKAEDAMCGKDEDDNKKAEDEHADEEEDKKLIKKEMMKEKGMDADSVNAAIQKGIKEGLAKMKAEQMAMDSALQSYEKLFGKANRMAMDSADAVYDAILNAKGLNAAGKTREQKAAMVEVVTASVQPKRVMAQDAANVDEFVKNNSMIQKYIS